MLLSWSPQEGWMIRKPVTLSRTNKKTKTRGKRVRCHLSLRESMIFFPERCHQGDDIVKRWRCLCLLIFLFYFGGKRKNCNVNVRNPCSDWKRASRRYVVKEREREDVEASREREEWRKSRVMFVFKRKLANSIVPNGRRKDGMNLSFVLFSFTASSFVVVQRNCA